MSPRHPWYDHTVGLCVEKCWRISLKCANPACLHGSDFSVQKLRDLPQMMTLGTLANSAHCKVCGHVGAEVNHYQDGFATSERDYSRASAEEAQRAKAMEPYKKP